MKFQYLLAASLAIAMAQPANGQMFFGKPKEVSDSAYLAQAQTPPMGWNSWNKFGCNVSEKLIMDMADKMVETGMKDAGYEYVVIDDCWQVDRDSLGFIQADPDRFPHGMKYLADYIHSKGLKFGLYSCAGSYTCQGRPGSRGHQFQDALMYAKWGVDFLKYDWCSDEGQNAQAAYATMSDAIKESGRPIILSICEWGEHEPWKWGKGIGHLWRVTADIRDCYQCLFDWGGVGVLNVIDKMADLYPYAGPGHWNDAEMLEVGNGGMTKDEYMGQFLELCSIYMKRLDSFTKLVNRKLVSGQVDDLVKMMKSQKFSDEQHSTFYKEFDNAFLKIYTTFVDDVNALLRPEERFEIEAPGSLNTELRIYALLRLGIVDSSKIAEFLRYSVNTIYAYRNKMKNRAIDRDSFEKNVMKICIID